MSHRKKNLLKRCALQNSSKCIASPVFACSSCWACSEQRAASSVLNSCMNCKRVELPPFSSSWAEAISCQHHSTINWNGTKRFNCGLGIVAESELNVSKTLNDKFHLAGLVWPFARKCDALHDDASAQRHPRKGTIAKLTH